MKAAASRVGFNTDCGTPPSSPIAKSGKGGILFFVSFQFFFFRDGFATETHGDIDEPAPWKAYLPLICETYLPE